MITPAKISQINQILTLTTACRMHMESKNIFQWTTAYPSENVFVEDIARKELFVYLLQKEIIGCIVVSTRMDAEYEPIAWLTPNKNNRYIHRLAVHPKFQGKGYAQLLMDFAEHLARDKQAISVRLDTFSQNKRNQHFYERRGYQKLADIHFPKQSIHPFHCYELVL
ncbi:MAG: GNAT family N-acetyltransferase [Maribacter sp.]